MGRYSHSPRSGLHRAGAIIVAAGEGRRMGGEEKVFAPIGDTPLIAYTVQAFEASPEVDAIVLVLGARNVERGRELAQQQGWRKVRAVCVGGARRQDSVHRGLGALPPCQWVLVHDGARPCVSAELIRQGLSAAARCGAAVAAVPVNDTIKVISPDGLVQETPDRSTLWAVQTPQVFRRDILEEAHRTEREDVTDDAAMVERLGYKVRVFQGAKANLKITTPQDLRLAELLLLARREG